MLSQEEQAALASELCRLNLVKKLMHENKFVHSFGLRVAFSVEMPLIAKRAGYSAILMNLKHMAIGIETIKNIAITAAFRFPVACCPQEPTGNFSLLHRRPKKSLSHSRNT
jgi:hypothetical protein